MGLCFVCLGLWVCGYVSLRISVLCARVCVCVFRVVLYSFVIVCDCVFLCLLVCVLCVFVCFGLRVCGYVGLRNYVLCAHV